MKKYLLGLVALMAIAVFSAFNLNGRSVKADPPTEGYFIFVGLDTEQNDAEMYEFAGVEPPSTGCGTDEAIICTILAPIDHNDSPLEENWRPDFSVSGNPVNNLVYTTTKKPASN